MLHLQFHIRLVARRPPGNRTQRLPAYQTGVHNQFTWSLGGEAGTSPRKRIIHLSNSLEMATGFEPVSPGLQPGA